MKYKIYSSELVLYETIIEGKSEADAWIKFELNTKDEVDRTGFQTDNIIEVT